MSTPSRREFFTYAAAATLASALPASAQTKTSQSKKDTTPLPPKDRPLVVDVIGPMAFQWSGSRFDVWMPDLHATHEAGILTPAMGFALDRGNYEISGTVGSADNQIIPYPTKGGQIYQAGTSEPPKEYFIHISLPMPFDIVLLYPEPAKIWSNGNKPADYTPYAVGLRLLYAHAGKPALSTSDGAALPPGAPKYGVIQFDPGPAKVLDMSVSYSPYNAGDPHDATNSFEALAALLKLNLQIEFPKPPTYKTMQHPCKSAAIRLA